MFDDEITRPCPTCGMQVEQTPEPFMTRGPAAGTLVRADRTWMCPLCDTVINAVGEDVQVFAMTGPGIDP